MMILTGNNEWNTNCYNTDQMFENFTAKYTQMSTTTTTSPTGADTVLLSDSSCCKKQWDCVLR